MKASSCSVRDCWLAEAGRLKAGSWLPGGLAGCTVADSCQGAVELDADESEMLQVVLEARGDW